MGKVGFGAWLPDERSQFEEGIIQYGWGKWFEIASFIPSRSKRQVKSHAQKFGIHRPAEKAELIKKHEKAKMKKNKKNHDFRDVSEFNEIASMKKKTSGSRAKPAPKPMPAFKKAKSPVAVGGPEPELRDASKFNRSPTKSDVAEGKPEVAPFSSVVTPSSSLIYSADAAAALKDSMPSLDYFLDELIDVSSPLNVEDASFAFEVENLINLEEEGDIIPVALDDQEINSGTLMQLRLQVQPNEGVLDEITKFLESPPDKPTSESKSTLMRRRIIRLTTEASDVGWWRKNETFIPENTKQAHLEHLVALTFAVLQADVWKRSDHVNAQDDIRNICSLLPGLWDRVIHSLAENSFELFGDGSYPSKRSQAVKEMILMFSDIPLQYG